MGNPLDSATFVRLLDTRLREVGERTYSELPTMIDTMYRMLPSDSAWEEFFSVGAVPDIPEFTGKISYLGVAPGYHIKIEPKEYSGGLQHERKLIDDKKYDVLNDRATGLMEAAQRTREKLGVRAFANAFSTAFDFMTSEEAIALCGSHLTKAGTSTTNGFDNSGTSALSKTSLAAARISMRQFRNDISERIDVGYNLGLVVPSNLADTAFEIVNTPKGLDSAEGNVNPNYKRAKIIEYPRLDDTDTNNWYLVDMDRMKQMLIWIDRIKPEVKTTVDFSTYMLQTAVYFRCAYGWKDWRFIYGQNVS
jgi:phage major head subunit gpT-like protein